MSSADGPLKVLLRRSLDKPARLHLQRWKPDRPVTIALDLEEMDELMAMYAIARGQLAIAAHSETSTGSVLDLSEMLATERAA